MLTESRRRRHWALSKKGFNYFRLASRFWTLPVTSLEISVTVALCKETNVLLLAINITADLSSKGSHVTWRDI